MAEGGGGVRMRKILAGILCLGLVLTTLNGCFRITADDLYSLPQPSREYLKLQERLTAYLASGAEYSPPLSGPNRQSVQLKDLDSDGRNEAIAFFRTAGDKPLRITILKQVDDSYRTAGVIEGDGTAIERIRYADLDDDGVSEFIVGWQMSAALLHMAIYSIKGGQPVLLAGDDYTELSVGDFDSDGRQDVVTLRLPSTGLSGQADMFSLRPDGEMDITSARLSKGFEAITHLRKGTLSDGGAALFVEGTCGGGSVVTDILSWRYGSLSNITANLSSGVSEDTLRSYKIYSADIDGDSVIEVPIPRLLQGSPAETKYYVIDWYKYSRFGTKSRVFTTYHDFSDGWYLILPEDWKNSVAVRRQDSVAGERTIIFSFLSSKGSTPIDFLKIYTLSGDNKNDRAKLPGRFTLLEHGDTIYAVEILTEIAAITVNKTQITGGFRPLYSDWANGAVS